MSVCTFFGHRDCPETIRPLLREAVLELIHCGIDVFYMGNQGAFDRMARGVLRELSREFPHIRYAVVLAYMPKETDQEDLSDSMLPEGFETVHPRFAIAHRNRWMVNRADYVVCCITHSWGGAAQAVELAKRQKKTVIDLTSRMQKKEMTFDPFD